MRSKTFGYAYFKIPHNPLLLFNNFSLTQVCFFVFFFFLIPLVCIFCCFIHFVYWLFFPCFVLVLLFFRGVVLLDCSRARLLTRMTNEFLKTLAWMFTFFCFVLFFIAIKNKGYLSSNQFSQIKFYHTYRILIINPCKPSKANPITYMYYYKPSLSRRRRLSHEWQNKS